MTIVCVDEFGHLSATNSEHWAWTALYNASPVRLEMFVPPVKSVVAHMALMSPAMSRVPPMDNDCDLLFAKTSLMPDNFDALSDLSVVVDCLYSPAEADNIAETSFAVLSITDKFRFLKSASWSDAWDNARSRALTSGNLDEHIQRRYVSLAVLQNWSIQVKYASRHVL